MSISNGKTRLKYTLPLVFTCFFNWEVVQLGEKKSIKLAPWRIKANQTYLLGCCLSSLNKF